MDSDARTFLASAKRGAIWWGERSTRAGLLTVVSRGERSVGVCAWARGENRSAGASTHQSAASQRYGSCALPPVMSVPAPEAAAFSM